MTVIRYKNRLTGKSFNNSLNSFYPPFASLYWNEAKDENYSKQNLPVNITENESGYLFEVLAAGFEKEDFRIGLDNNQLIIETEKKEQELKENDKIIKREYKISSFKRSFTVDDLIDAEKITATYQNGVLLLSLPKKVEVKEPVKKISIS